ncbi:uncharacterized protein LOC134805109 [Cydia splendana]|uniref:uncharacterized protein LOC134805109 n=1 Tax=Cydia splendana TaxID=1100963 RepID=UPI00300C186F
MMRGAGIFLILLYFTGTLEQTIYDANNFYKPMTEDYDVKLNGQVFLPPCMKQLMNCWELVNAELVCKYTRIYKQALESMCMDLRLQCTEFTGPLPFETLNVSNWNYCPLTREELSKVDFRPNIFPESNN